MNVYEEYKKTQEEFIKTMQEAFNSYLTEHNGGNFSFYALQEFSKNELYINHAKPQELNHIKAFLNTYESQIATEYNEDKAQAKELLKKIYRHFPNTHVKPWENYIDSVVNFDDSKDYKSLIFERRFPTGTISYIGARPGRGKTTILVNIALDALNQGKPVIFVTAEETTKQILTRFILSKTASNKPGDGRLGYESFKPRTALYNYIKDNARNLPQMPVENKDFFGDAYDTIGDYINKKMLTIFEAYGATWDELTEFISDQEAGSVILIDYIQHLKTPELFATQTRQIQIQETSHQLADLAGLHGLILICGAQFNREAKGNGQGKPDLLKADSFDETSFREAGDIEQDGHILIGIGKDPKAEVLFYSCMKDREASPDNGKRWKLEKNLPYSFLQGEKDDQGNKIEYTPGKGKDDDGKGTGTQTEEEKINAMKNFSYGRK